MPLIEYVLVYEQAHVTRPGGRAHGSAWQQRMNLWMSDWQQRKTELASGRPSRLARRLEVQVMSLTPVAYGDGFVSDDAHQRRPTRTHQMWNSVVVVHSLIQQRAPVGRIG